VVDLRPTTAVEEGHKMTMVEEDMQINPLDVAAALSDAELLASVKTLAANERNVTALLVAHLAEMDARRLYLGEGCSSLFTYCTQVLHLSEHAAYGRIEAARAARKCPALLEAIGSGAPPSHRRQPHRPSSDSGECSSPDRGGDPQDQTRR
jgi:hypothetical protein